jgi:peptide/nickel transport system permease protein
MLNYFIRRLIYMVPILLGVMLITFVLFNIVASPREMALQNLGPKASAQAIENWLHNRGYSDEHGKPYPLFLNTERGHNPFDSLYFRSMKRFATFDLGTSFATGEPVVEMIKRGAIPSLCITLPAFVVGLFLSIATALLLVFVRDSLIDRWGAVLCVATMSIPITVYVIFGQWMAANLFNYFPAFGFTMEGFSTARFIALPVAIMIFSGLGVDVRMYRAVFLEEVRADYIRTAQAKGASHARVLLVHMLKNGMISLITLVVAALPFLIMGTLVIESFFGIPGLGNLMTTAIQTKDFGVIQADVYFGSLLYLFGLLLTDICYAAVDPRIRLQ